MTAFGRLYGVGVGPGDPELLTVKATHVIAAAPVVAFFAKAGRRGNARAIVDCWLKPSHLELPLFYPMTDESHFDDPPYRDALVRFYKESAMAIAAHLEAGRDVALVSEGWTNASPVLPPSSRWSGQTGGYPGLPPLP